MIIRFICVRQTKEIHFSSEQHDTIQINKLITDIGDYYENNGSKFTVTRAGQDQTIQIK